MRSLSICVHGEPGVGKSWLAASSPAPRLVLDAEGGARFTRGRKMYWDPAAYGPPAAPAEGEWDTCVVSVKEWRTFEQVYGHLVTGNHPFNSIVIDSLTEIQRRLVDVTAGIDQPTNNQWGEVLRRMEDQVRKYRDLLENPVRPIQCLVLVALTKLGSGKFRPFVRGQLELTLPGYVDVVGYLNLELGPDGEMQRKLTINPLGDIEAKDRTHALTAAYGYALYNPDLSVMLDVIDAAT